MLADFALPAAHVSHTLETAKERIAAGLGAKLAEMKTKREELFPWEVYAHECEHVLQAHCLLYTSPSPRDKRQSRMPSSA